MHHRSDCRGRNRNNCCICICICICLLTYKCLHGLAPEYSSRSCIPPKSVAAGNNELYVPRTRTVTFGPRAFSSLGPKSWNSLTSALRDPALTIDMFQRKLKTELFVVWFDCHCAGLCDDLSLIVRFEMSVIIIIIIIEPKAYETYSYAAAMLDTVNIPQHTTHLPWIHTHHPFTNSISIHQGPGALGCALQAGLSTDCELWHQPLGSTVTPNEGRND